MRVNETSIALTDDHVLEKVEASINANGFALVTGVFSPFELEAITSLCRAIEEEAVLRFPQYCALKNGELWAVRHVYEIYPEVMRQTLTTRAMGLLPKILGGTAQCCGSTLMVKSPGMGDTGSVGWHQDNGAIVDRLLDDEYDRGLAGPYPKRRMRKETLVTMCEARIHVDAQTQENGCLQVIPGSSNWERSMLGEELMAHVRQHEPVLVPSPAGSVLFMRPMLAHASGPCTQDAGEGTRRRVIQAEFHRSDITPGDGSLFYEWKHPAEIREDGVFCPIPLKEEG